MKCARRTNANYCINRFGGSGPAWLHLFRAAVPIIMPSRWMPRAFLLTFPSEFLPVEMEIIRFPLDFRFDRETPTKHFLPKRPTNNEKIVLANHSLNSQTPKVNICFGCGCLPLLLLAEGIILPNSFDDYTFVSVATRLGWAISIMWLQETEAETERAISVFSGKWWFPPRRYIKI